MLKRANRVVSLAAALLVAAPGLAGACPVCFGGDQGPLAAGSNMGIFTLLAFTVGVLGGFAIFFVHLMRRVRVVSPAVTAGAGALERTVRC